MCKLLMFLTLTVLIINVVAQFRLGGPAIPYLGHSGHSRERALARGGSLWLGNGPSYGWASGHHRGHGRRRPYHHYLWHN